MGKLITANVKGILSTDKPNIKVIIKPVTKAMRSAYSKYCSIYDGNMLLPEFVVFGEKDYFTFYSKIKVGDTITVTPISKTLNVLDIDLVRAKQIDIVDKELVANFLDSYSNRYNTDEYKYENNPRVFVIKCKGEI